MEAPPKFAGTYRIESWRDLEGRGLYHFFYLHPGGRFLLAAEWPNHESSRFAGAWNVSGDRLYLNGRGKVRTLQKSWQVEYRRTFLISVRESGFLLRPLPEKNRYGLMGWPDGFRYHLSRPAPNLPGGKIPTDEDAILDRILTLLTSMPKG